MIVGIVFRVEMKRCKLPTSVGNLCKLINVHINVQKLAQMFSDQLDTKKLFEPNGPGIDPMPDYSFSAFPSFHMPVKWACEAIGYTKEK